MKFKISPKIIKNYPTLFEAIIVLKNIDNTVKGKDILKLLREEETKQKKKLKSIKLSQHPTIKAWRDAFRAFGSKPNKYSSSIEALLKRVVKGKNLPDINPLVNLYNYCSIKHMLPFGGEDFSRVYGNPELKYCKGNEEFIPMFSKNNELPDKGEIAWVDDKGVTCRKWNWRQCDRTKITENIKQGYFIIDGLSPTTKKQIEQAAHEFITLAKKYLKASGTIYWLDKDNREIEINIKTKKSSEKESSKQSLQKVKAKKRLKETTKKKIQKNPLAEFEDKNTPQYQIRKIIYKALKECSYDKYIKEKNISIQHPQNEDFGDYATNIAMILAKNLKKIPNEIAKKIKEQIASNDLIHQIEIIGGFINFKLKKEWLSKQLRNILKEGTIYGSSKKKKDFRVIIEFGQPNTHKMPHIGHLFSYVLGESLARIIKAMGVKTYRANYQGDVGPHVAKCIWAFNQSSPKVPPGLREKAELLQQMYQKGSTTYKKDKKAKQEIDVINKKIYLKDPTIKKLWKRTRSWSVDYYKEFEKRIGVSYDRYYFESETADRGKEIVKANVGKVFKKSQGAIIFEGSKFGLHDRVFITKKGTPTYEAKDMALQEIKYKEWPFDFMVIMTAHEQNEYFKVVFKALEKLDKNFEGKLMHLGFGMVNLKTGKMSSRTGNIITGIGLIEHGTDAIRELVKDRKNLTNQEKEEITEKVGIGAIKYSLLKSNPLQDMSFDIEESISFEGNSGPYLQYTYTRAKSILREVNSPTAYCLLPIAKFNKEEIAILRTLYKFPEIVFEAGVNLAPNLLCSYLFDLAQKFNLFYKKHKVLKIEKEKREARLAITAATTQVIKNGLNLLGIEVLEKM